MLGQSIGFLQASEDGNPGRQLKSEPRSDLGQRWVPVGPNSLTSEQMIAVDIAALDVKLGAAGSARGCGRCQTMEEKQDKKQGRGQSGRPDVDFDILKNNADSAAMQLKSLDWDVESHANQGCQVAVALKGSNLAIMVQYAQLQQAGVYALQAEHAAASGRIVNGAQSLRIRTDPSKRRSPIYNSSTPCTSRFATNLPR